MNKILIIILLTGITLYNFGQSDNEFWFAAPDVTAGHTCGTNPTPGHGRPVIINITAEQSTNVIIEMPGNPAFTPIEFSLSAGESRWQEIAPPFMPDIYENFPMSYPPLNGQTMQKKAFHITSYPGNITAYYELNNDCNRDIFALKGRNALGTDFYVSTQNYWSNGSYTPIPYSGFIIAATEDNTTIEISRNGQWQFFPGSPTVETIVLNRGETFAFVASSQDAAQHIMGVKVHANKKIAITWYDDSVAKGSCRDIIGDQLIPVNYIGRNYIVMKGDVQATNGGERFFVTATENNTDVFVDGILKVTLNEGQTYNEEIINLVVQIYTSQPAYVNHITGIGGGCEIGGATLPTTDGCTGSHKVSSKRSNNTIDPFLLNLMVRNDNNPSSPFYNKSIENFEIVTGVDTFKIPAFYFSFLNDSSWAYLKNEVAVRSFIFNIITPGTTYSIINTQAKFHLGVQNGSAGAGGKYGYFSDYSYNRGKAGIGGSNGPKIKNYCSLDSIFLVAEGGYNYKWFCQDSPGDSIYLSSTTSDAVVFKPADYGINKFGVSISRSCSADTVIFLQARYIEPPIAESDISKENACSGEPVTLINNTDMTLASAIRWTVGENINDSIAYPYIYSLVNNTDSIIEKKFVLVA
ncbi:MAG: IgGFc-binding protein [Ignavibacteriaceae bacterium]